MRRTVVVACLVLVIGGVVAMLLPLSPDFGPAVGLPSCGNSLFGHESAAADEMEGIQEICSGLRDHRQAEAWPWVVLGVVGLGVGTVLRLARTERARTETVTV